MSRERLGHAFLVCMGLWAVCLITVMMIWTAIDARTFPFRAMPIGLVIEMWLGVAGMYCIMTSKS